MIGLVAALAVLGLMAMGGGSTTALEWSIYDRWVRARPARHKA